MQNWIACCVRRARANKQIRKLWLKAQQDRIQELLKLEQDWNSYGADPPNRESAQNLRTVIDKVPNKFDIAAIESIAAVFPSAAGGMAIAFQTDKLYADVECLNTGEILAVIAIRGLPKCRVWDVKEVHKDQSKALDIILER